MLTFLLLLVCCTLPNIQGLLPEISEDLQIPKSCSDNPSPTCSASIEGDTCPPGQFCKNGSCMCVVSPHKIIVCHGPHSYKLKYYSVTFDEDENLTSAGFSLVSLATIQSNGTVCGDLLYNELPDDTHKVTKAECGSMNRTGTLCGRCLPGQYPLAYSYNMACVQCPHISWNWVRYIMAAYIPLTLFCIVILIFNINTTSSHLFAVVYYCQVLTAPLLMRLATLVTGSISFLPFPISSVLSIYAVWNLDFFRPLYSDLCLGIGILPILALDYAIAVYPLFLLVLIYLLVALYDRNCRIIVVMWKPFRYITLRFRKNWDARTSIVDAFATFFFLSNIKFLSTSSDHLYPTRVYKLYPNYYHGNLRLLYSADVEYFGEEHLPYAILAISMLCIFVLLPISVLFLYPFPFFRKFLNHFSCHWYILHTFMDSFQGCYKDGTEPGTRDYRWFAAVFFIIRLNVIWLPSLVDLYVMSGSLNMGMLIVQTTLTAVLQPYKSSHSYYNIINATFLLFLTLLSLSAYGLALSSLTVTRESMWFFAISGFLCYIIPLVYIIGLSCCWVYTHRKFGSNITLRLKAWRNRYRLLPETFDAIPDRIENSYRYPKENMAKFS